MENIIATIRFQELDAATASDVELLLTHNKQKDSARHLIMSMTLAAGGREIGEHESDLVIELPLDQANTVRDIHARLEEDEELSTTIGVGDDLQDAKLALDWAVKNRPGTIKVMEPSIEKEAKSANTDRHDHINPQELAFDSEGRPVQMHKADDDTDDFADDKEAVSDEMKQKIAAIIQTLQSKKEYLQALQQSNPDVYAGVVGLVNSISAMAQSAKMQDAEKHSKMITHVARHLDRAEEKNLDDQAADVLEMLIQAQLDHQEAKDSEGRARHEAAKRRYQSRSKSAREHAKKTGADPKFLMKLNRAFRD